MIDHNYKCIFIHIPRTGGTSIEQGIRGNAPYLDIGRQDKHLLTHHILASTSKKIYAEHWDDYFKFSFVRNPWSRMVSTTKFPRFFGAHIENGLLNIEGYLEKFPKIEIDPRSKSRDHPLDNIIDGAVYLNILNEKLDFIGKFENLQEDFDTVCDKIGVPPQKLPHISKSHSVEGIPHSLNTILKEQGDPKSGCAVFDQSLQAFLRGDQRHYTENYDDETRKIVSKLYKKDIEYFGYEFGE